MMGENNKIKDIPEDLRDKIQESKNLVADIVLKLLYENISEKEKEINLLYENISEKEKEIKLLWSGIEIVREWLKDDTKSVSDILSILSSKSNAGKEVK